MDSIDRGRDDPDPAPGRRPAAPAPRRRHGQPGDDAGRVRPLQHEAVGEPDGQHRGRGPGPGRRPGRAGDRRGPARRPRGRPSTSAGRSRRWTRSSGASAIGLGMAIVVILLLLTANFQSVRLALVVVSTAPAVVAGVVAHALADRDDGQPPVVHGGDHGHRRRGGQRDPAGHLRRAAPPRGAGRARHRPRSRAPRAGSGRS